LPTFNAFLASITFFLNSRISSIQNTTNFIKTDINRDFEKQLNNLRSDIYSKLDGIQDNTKYLQKDVIKTTNEIYQQAKKYNEEIIEINKIEGEFNHFIRCVIQKLMILSFDLKNRKSLWNLILKK
jgi:hypothetical protein